MSGFGGVKDEFNDNDEVDFSAATLTPGSHLATEEKQDTAIASLNAIAGLVTAAYDYVSLSYTGDNLTGVVFKTGGSGGTTVATLTLAYTGANLTSVTKT